MATKELSELANADDWQQALDTLIDAAIAACEPGSTAADQEAARAGLRAFRSFPCPFADMRRDALEALNDLTLASINQALETLQNLQRQLQADKTR